MSVSMKEDGDHNRYEFIVNAASELLTLIDSHYVYNEANRAYCVAHGKERSEIVGHSVADVWGEEVFQTNIKPQIDSCLKGEKHFYTNYYKFGSLGDRFMEVSYHPYESIPGQVTHCVVVSHDVTELVAKEHLMKKMNDDLEVRVRERTLEVENSNKDLLREIDSRGKYEREIANAHLKLRQIIDSIQTIIISTNLDLTIVRWNPMAEKFLLLPLRHTVGKKLPLLPISWDKEIIENGIKECSEKLVSVPLKEITIKGNDDQLRILGLSINPIFDYLKANTGFLLWGTDITEKKNLEFQILQSQKLESIGQLAAGVAHEINTPMQYIGDNLQYMKKKFGTLSTAFGQTAPVNTVILKEFPKAIDEAIEGVSRVTKIIRSMREFSHPGQEKQAMADINMAIDSTINISRNEWKYSAEMVFQPDPSLPNILCNSGELNQVFLNIIINATHAIQEKQERSGNKDKGTITIRTKYGDNYVAVQITDTGNGIPEKAQSRIFDPFFTTKAIGKGTGQGLFIARKVVAEKHGGSLTFTTIEGVGTTFNIILPVAGKPPVENKKAV
jgi:PAS domain S-box-containing protein